MMTGEAVAVHQRGGDEGALEGDRKRARAGRRRLQRWVEAGVVEDYGEDRGHMTLT